MRVNNATNPYKGINIIITSISSVIAKCCFSVSCKCNMRIVNRIIAAPYCVTKLLLKVTSQVALNVTLQLTSV